MRMKGEIPRFMKRPLWWVAYAVTMGSALAVVVGLRGGGGFPPAIVATLGSLGVVSLIGLTIIYR
jgi:hypothetical protein